MSAYVVNKAHIDLIVEAAIKFEVISPSDADNVGKMLWETNHDSVNYRYSEKVKCPKYKHKKPETTPTPVEALKAVNCLEYQSCEHDEWAKSEAKLFLQKIASAAVRELPGYDEAKWSIS